MGAKGHATVNLPNDLYQDLMRAVVEKYGRSRLMSAVAAQAVRSFIPSIPDLPDDPTLLDSQVMLLRPTTATSPSSPAATAASTTRTAPGMPVLAAVPSATATRASSTEPAPGLNGHARAPPPPAVVGVEKHVLLARASCPRCNALPEGVYCPRHG